MCLRGILQILREWIRSKFYIIFLFNLHLCVCVPVCVCVFNVCKCLWRLEKGIQSCGAGVNRWLWAIQHGYWELNLGPLQEQPALLTTEPSLPPKKQVFIVDSFNALSSSLISKKQLELKQVCTAGRALLHTGLSWFRSKSLMQHRHPKVFLKLVCLWPKRFIFSPGYRYVKYIYKLNHLLAVDKV